MTKRRIAEIVATLPGKDCGQCGFRTCAGLAEVILHDPGARRRCVHLGPGAQAAPRAVAVAETAWHDILGREYQMVLEPFPEDPGPRENILPFNPALAERLGLERGDIVFGRPAGVGCPVTHVGRLMDAPDPLTGALVWCVVGPVAARAAHAIEIGGYHIIAYDGLVRETRVTPQVGGRYYFKPALCMLQSRHSGVVSFAAQRPDGWRLRFEGIAIE
ncbi:MAG: (Fe-S)-binding protein [Gammaproteobacteria bacterium]